MILIQCSFSILNSLNTYSKFFELRIAPIDLCQYFGYGFTLSALTLPKFTEPLVDLHLLERRIVQISTRLISRNEQAKREMLVAPIIEFLIEKELGG